MSLSEELQAVAKRLLEEGKVEVVIGYARASLPLRSTPLFVRDAGEAGKLIFDHTCGANLVRYLRDTSDRAAVVVKGCDSRSLVESLKEQQLDREKIVVVGVPCEGIVDADAVRRSLGVPELLSAELEGKSIRVRTRKGEETLALDGFLCERCRSCEAREVVLADERVGQAALPSSAEKSALEGFEAKSPEERWAYFSAQADKCILCYACRNACPLCYCPECFAECTQPRWLGTEHNLSNAQVYHLMRAIHLAGRCVGCGDCARACPMGVDVGFLGEKLREVVKELYGA